MMYTIDDVIERLRDLKAVHGGNVPFVIASMPGGDVFENVVIELGFATLHDDGDGGELFKRKDDENDRPICVVF